MRLLSKGQKEPSLAFGGQAVMEGVMIRSKKHMVVCVRQPNDQILTKTEELHSLSEKSRFLKLPFVRGILALFETLFVGIKGIYFSANTAFGDEEEEISFSPKEIVVVVALALGLSILLFSITPFFLTSLMNLGGGVVFNVVEGIIRLSFLLVYLAAVSRIRDLKRVFQYHGAEHTAINAYEAGVELNVENARRYPRFHARCGTSFLLIVMVISILLFSLVPNFGYWVRLSYRILLIPVIASVSYELLRLSDRYKDSRIMKIITAPGLALQQLTTQPPDDKMIAVAIEAIKATVNLQKTEL
jgi:uncharacterized protein YqhQ